MKVHVGIPVTVVLYILWAPYISIYTHIIIILMAWASHFQFYTQWLDRINWING